MELIPLTMERINALEEEMIGQITSEELPYFFKDMDTLREMVEEQ